MRAIKIFILCGSLIGFPTKSMNGTGQEEVSDIIFFKVEPQTIEEQILAVLIDSGFSISDQKIILAQSKHESGHYTNSITKKNNVFSLYKRKSSLYALPDKARAEGCTCFATYRTIKDGTLDYLQLRKRFGVPPNLSVEKYVSYIKRKNYFTDNEARYLYSMKKLIRQDDELVANFNTRYPGCPRGPYTIAEINAFVDKLTLPRKTSLRIFKRRD